MSVKPAPIDQTDGNSSVDTNTGDTPKNFFTRGWDAYKAKFVDIAGKHGDNNWFLGFLMALPLFFFFIFVGLLILAGMTGKLTPFWHFIKKAIASVFTDKGSKEKD